jgi:hypothetical protein
MNIHKPFITVSALCFFPFFLLAQVEPGDGSSQEKLYQENLKTLEEEKKAKPGDYGYVRFWNMSSKDTAPVLFVLKPEKNTNSSSGAGLVVINTGFRGGDMTGYRKLPSGKYKVGFFKPLVATENGEILPLVWEKLEPMEGKNLLLDVNKDRCRTAIIEKNTSYSLNFLDDDDEPAYGVQIRILHRVADQPVEIGYILGGKENSLWTGNGPALEIKQIQDLNKLTPFYADITKKSGIKARRSFEIDCSFIHSHTLIVMTDPYGRVVCRAYRDGLKAAIGAQ